MSSEHEPTGATGSSKDQGDTSAPNEETNNEETNNGETNNKEQELIDQLNRLGNQFAAMIRQAWDSNERRQIENDLRTGLVSVASSLEDGFKKLSEREETQEIFDRAEDVAETVSTKVRDSKAANELAGGLAKGLSALSAQLEKLAADMAEKKEARRGDSGQQPASGDDSDDDTPQDIPIDRA